MSDLAIGRRLTEWARAHVGAADPPPVEGLALLLAFGRLAEADPDAAGFAAGEWTIADAETLHRWAQGERQEDLAFLRRQLDALEDCTELLDMPAILADDPEAAESAQAQALAALHTRERIHQLGVAATWLEKDGAIQGEMAGQTAAVDERLGKIVGCLAVLAPERARMAAQVDPAERAAHWWWTAPCAEALEQRDAANESALAQLQRWAAERVVASPAGAKLRLASEETAALMATPKGQRLAAFLGDRLDFDLAPAAPQTHHGSVAEVLASAASVAVTGSGNRLAPVLPLWRPGESRRPERLAAATAPDRPVLAGLDALAGVFCTAAELLPGIGVVAHGTRAFDGGRQRVWLFVPELEVASLQLAGTGAPWLAELWSPGGLAIAADAVDEPFEVTAARGTGGDSPAIHEILEPGPAQAQPSLLTRLLRHVHDEQRDTVHSDWEELVASCDGELGQALSGLRLALTKLFGDEWS